MRYQIHNVNVIQYRFTNDGYINLVNFAFRLLPNKWKDKRANFNVYKIRNAYESKNKRYSLYQLNKW